jgi:uncharacterized membrane protein
MPLQEKENYESHLMPLAVASVIMGVLSCILFGILLGVPAIICGKKALSRLREEPNPTENMRLAKAGIILGSIGILVTITIIFILITIYFDLTRYPINI